MINNDTNVLFGLYSMARDCVFYDDYHFFTVGDDCINMHFSGLVSCGFCDCL